MKVSCPSCSATLNIDDKKIPAGGARIKCPTCAHVFPVKAGSSASAVALPGAAAASSGSSAGRSPGASGAVPLPGLSAPKPDRQQWEEAPTRAVPVSGIPGALTAAAPPSNIGVPLPGQATRTGVMPGLGSDHDVTRAGAVPLPGMSAQPTSSASDWEEQTNVGAIPSMPPSSDMDFDFSNPSSNTGSVPLPGASAAPSSAADSFEETTANINNPLPSGSVPLPGSSRGSAPAITLDSSSADGGFSSPSGSAPLPGHRAPPAAHSSSGSRGSASGYGGSTPSGSVPLPGASRAAAPSAPAAWGGSTPSGSVPLPGGSRAGSSAATVVAPGFGRSAPSGSVPLPGARSAATAIEPAYDAPAPTFGGGVPLPGGRTDQHTPLGSSPYSDAEAEAEQNRPFGAAAGVPLPGGFDDSAVPLDDGFSSGFSPEQPASTGGFDFAASGQDPAMGGGFDFSEAPAPLPEPTSTGMSGFDFPEAPAPQAATSAGFDFVEAPPPVSVSGFDFSSAPPPPPPAVPPPDDLAFDFNAPAPAAPSFGEVDFGAPPPPAGGDELEFDPMGGGTPRGDDLEADLNAPLRPAPLPSGPTDGLEMLSFIDDTAKEAGAPAEGSTAPSRRFHIRRRSGKVFGPFEEAVIVKMMEDGQLLGNEEVSVDTETWQPIGAEPAFQAVIARLMEAPARAETAQGLPPVADQQPKGPSMERLKQLYEGRMAAVAVVQGKEPVPFKKRVPYLVAAALVIAVVGTGVFAGTATPYGFFFLKKLFPARVKADTREFGYLQAARKAFNTDTYLSYKTAREQTALALQVKEYPEARAVWAQSVYYLKRKYGISDPGEVAQADSAIDRIVLLGEKHIEVLKTSAGKELTLRNAAGAVGFIDEARQDDNELHFLRAEALLQQKQLGQAKAEFEQVLKSDPKSPRALHALGLVAKTQKDLDGALAKFEEALVAEPLHASSAIELAEISLMEKKDRVKGQKYLDQALTDEARKQLAPPELGKALGLRAETLVIDNKITEAVPLFEEALKADPNNAFAKAGLGQTYMALHQPEKAAPLFAAANAAVPDKLDYAEGYLTSLIALGKMDEAQKVVQATNQLFPGNAMLAYLSGRVSDAIDKPKEAEEAYKRAIAADPSIADAYLYLARLYIRFRRFAESRPVLEAGLEKDANNAALRVGMGELAFYARDIERAEIEFKKASELNPNSAEAFLGLSRVALEREKLDLASAHVDKALTLNPRVSGGRLQKGIALWKLGRLEESIKELTQAREDEPRNVQIMVMLGAVELEKGDMADALSHLSSATQAETVPPDAYFYLARVKNAKLEHTQAIENMKRALDYDAKNPTYHYWMGKFLSDAKKIDDAIAEWNQALELDPKYADALEAMGRVYFDQNKLTLAIEYFNKVLAADPSRNVVRAWIGDAQMKVEDWGSAIASYSRAIEAEPDNKELNYVYLRLGQAHQEKGNIKEAIVWYKKSTELDPTNAEAYRSVGYLYKDSRKPKLAIEAFKKYLELQPNGQDKKDIDNEIYDLSKEK